MIAIHKQYVFSINVGGVQDFFGVHDLISAYVIEEVGNQLPTFEVIFKLRNKDLFDKMNQGSSCKIGIGIEDVKFSGIRYTQFIITGKEKLAENQNEATIRLVGIYDALSYITDTYVTHFKNMTSFEVLSSKVGKYFTFKTNLPNSLDKMTWHQTNVSDKIMINKLWLHSVFPEQDTPMVAITSKGEFLYKGVKKTMTEKFWNFQPDDHDWSSNTVLYETRPQYRFAQGTVDAYAGYAQSRIVHDVDSNKSSYNTPEWEIKMAQTGKDESIEPGSRISAISIQNTNVHDQYFDAKDYNTRVLAKISAAQCKVYWEKSFAYDSLSLLDKVKLDDFPERKGGYSHDTGGYWFISKICRKIEDQRFKMIVTLTKDMLNNRK